MSNNEDLIASGLHNPQRHRAGIRTRPGNRRGYERILLSVCNHVNSYGVGSPYGASYGSRPAAGRMVKTATGLPL